MWCYSSSPAADHRPVLDYVKRVARTATDRGDGKLIPVSGWWNSCCTTRVALALASVAVHARRETSVPGNDRSSERHFVPAHGSQTRIFD